MKNSDHEKLLSRRDALKALVATSSAVALSTLPNRWEKPRVQVGTLPAFAQSSPGQFPFTNEIEAIEFEGAPSSDFQFAVDPGWIIIAQTGTTISSASYPYPWIIIRPWIRIRRRFEILVAPGIWGALVITVKIKIRFFPRLGFGSDQVLADDNDIWCFGISGANLAAFQYYVVKFKIKNKRVEIEFKLPALTSGFFPFFLSMFFPTPLLLLGGGILSPGFYLGPGCAGGSITSSHLGS